MIFVSGTLIVIRLADLYDFICREQVVDNVTTSVCCEQLSLKAQPVLSIMCKNL